MKEKCISKSQHAIDTYFKNKASAVVLSEVVADWLRIFPELKRYKSGQKILKKVGPVIVGIELEKFLSDEYRPRVVAYNLLDNRNNRLVSIIDQTIKNKKGLDISIKYKQHAEEYVEACALLKNKARVDLFGMPAIEDIITGIIGFIEHDAAGVCFWSCQAVMQLSHLIDVEKKKVYFFNKGYDLLKQKVPPQFLAMQVGDVERWLRETKELNAEKINPLIEESIRKYKLEGVV